MALPGIGLNFRSRNALTPQSDEDVSAVFCRAFFRGYSQCVSRSELGPFLQRHSSFFNSWRRNSTSGLLQYQSQLQSCAPANLERTLVIEVHPLLGGISPVHFSAPGGRRGRGVSSGFDRRLDDFEHRRAFDCSTAGRNGGLLRLVLPVNNAILTIEPPVASTPRRQWQ